MPTAAATGKELAARAIHDRGPRRDRPFVAINCSALPETLLESELFGHAKGAFTGATRDRPGVFELAAGGTLFVDEIGEVSSLIQVKPLRVLESRELRRLGDDHPVNVDVRLITATNKARAMGSLLALRECVATVIAHEQDSARISGRADVRFGGTVLRVFRDAPRPVRGCPDRGILSV